MNLDLLPDVLAGALVLAGTYTLVGLAWVIVFKAAHLANFATGEMIVLAGYVLVSFTASGGNYWTGVLLTLLVMAAVGVITYRFFLRPFAGQPLFTPLIVTLGLATVVRGVMLIKWGPQTRNLNPPFENNFYELPAGIRLSTYDIIVPVIAVIVYLLVLAFLRYTKVGGQMRAGHESTLLASQSGINVYLLFSVAFAISVVAAGLAGIGVAQRTLVSTTAIPLGLKGLVPAMVGGFDSVNGVIVGAVLVATAESMATLYLGARWSSTAVFSILLVVLAFRPSGLFGSPEVQRV